MSADQVLRTILDGTRYETQQRWLVDTMSEIDGAAILLRRMYPSGDTATVAELITQAANELRQKRAQLKEANEYIDDMTAGEQTHGGGLD